MVLVSLSLMAAYAMSMGPARRWRRPLQVVWCRALCRLAGLRVRIHGCPRNQGSTLFVCNHVSYLDIPVIAVYADGTFVAKAEVAGWPLFGQAAKLTRTIFIQRIGAEAKAQGRQITERLEAGDNLVLFAEGTSTDGAGVAPFKSSLFAIAEQPLGVPLMVQPVAITYARAFDGTPLVGPLRELYCWFGEATMVPHLMRMLSLKGAEVELRFLEPVPAAGVGRKDLARRIEAAVASGVAASNAPLLGESSPQENSRPDGLAATAV